MPSHLFHDASMERLRRTHAVSAPLRPKLGQCKRAGWPTPRAACASNKLARCSNSRAISASVAVAARARYREARTNNEVTAWSITILCMGIPWRASLAGMRLVPAFDDHHKRYRMLSLIATLIGVISIPINAALSFAALVRRGRFSRWLMRA